MDDPSFGNEAVADLLREILGSSTQAKGRSEGMLMACNLFRQSSKSRSARLPYRQASTL